MNVLLLFFFILPVFLMSLWYLSLSAQTSRRKNKEQVWLEKQRDIEHRRAQEYLDSVSIISEMMVSQEDGTKRIVKIEEQEGGIKLQIKGGLSNCPLCRDLVDKDKVGCEHCSTFYHGECLEEMSKGICTTQGCKKQLVSPTIQVVNLDKKGFTVTDTRSAPRPRWLRF